MSESVLLIQNINHQYMRVFFLFIIAAIVCTAISQSARAQAVSSKIMDTSIDWTSSSGGVTGHLKVFLTDTIGITGLTVNYGSTDTTHNYFSHTYTIPGSFGSSGCTTNID